MQGWEWEPSDIFEDNLAVKEGSSELADHIDGVDEDSKGTVFWQFDKEGHVFEWDHLHEGNEEEEGEPLCAESGEGEVRFEGKVVNIVCHFGEGVDDGVELVDY